MTPTISDRPDDGALVIAADAVFQWVEARSNPSIATAWTCGLAATTLAWMLRLIRLSPTIVTDTIEGSGHMWVEMNGKYFDPTIGQFGEYEGSGSLPHPLSTHPSAASNTDGALVTALKLARPIVEGDLSSAKEYSDGDWIGMSQTALDAIADALASTPTNTAQVASVSPEPFGYWVEQKYADPVLLRKPSYIPEPSKLRTVTPLFAASPAQVASAPDRAGVILLSDALAVVDRMTPRPAGGAFSHTNSMRVIASDIRQGLAALSADRAGVDEKFRLGQLAITMLAAIEAHCRNEGGLKGLDHADEGKRIRRGVQAFLANPVLAALSATPSREGEVS